MAPDASGVSSLRACSGRSRRHTAAPAAPTHIVMALDAGITIAMPRPAIE